MNPERIGSLSEVVTMILPWLYEKNEWSWLFRLGFPDSGQARSQIRTCVDVGHGTPLDGIGRAHAVLFVMRQAAAIE